MAAVSTLTTTHRGHKIEIARFEWGYVARILGVGTRVTVASPSAFRALIDALALVDDWAASGALPSPVDVPAPSFRGVGAVNSSASIAP